MSRFARHTAVFSALTLLSRITGLLRMMAIAAILGSGWFNDAYLLANTIPNMIYEFIMGGLLTAIFIPVLVREQEKHGRTSAEAWRVANLLLGGVGAVLLAASVIGALASPQIVGLFTMLGRKVNAENSRELAVYFFRFFSWQMFFYGLNAVFMAILNSHDVFAITAAAPIINNVVMIGTLGAYYFGAIGSTGLAVGTTVGVVGMALAQVPSLIKVGMPIRPLVRFRDPVFVSVAALGVPALFVSLVAAISTAIRTNLLYTAEGGMVVFTFCFQLIMMPYGVFAVSIATVLYPALSRHAADNNISDFRSVFSTGVRWMTLVMLPITLGVSALAQPITRVLFERGQFAYADSVFMADLLRVYSLTILPYSILIFATRAFYALNEVIKTVWINTVGVALGITLNFLLMWLMGVPGIGLSATLSYVFTMLVTIVWLRHRIGGVDGWTIARSCSKMALAGLAMVVVVLGGLRLSEPQAVVVARGHRSAARIPPGSAGGSAVVVRDPQSLSQIWRMMKAGGAPPRVDYKRQSVIAVFGPRSATTSSLELRRLSIDSEQRAKLAVDVISDPRPAVEGVVGDLPTRPAWQILVVRGGVHDVTPEFRPTSVRPGRLARILQGPEFLRLVAMTVLGGVVYFGVAMLLRVREVDLVLARVRRRLGSG